LRYLILAEQWHSKNRRVLLLFFKSSAPYIGKDLTVVEKLQIKNVGPLHDMDSSVD